MRISIVGTRLGLALAFVLLLMAFTACGTNASSTPKPPSTAGPTATKTLTSTSNGPITEYLLPGSDSTPQGITVGPDGALWFAEAAGNQIGQFSPAKEAGFGGFTIDQDWP